MNKNIDKVLHGVILFIVAFGIVTSATGLFYTNGGAAYNFLNQYGDTVKMYGNGLYAHDSYFMAPIFRGTDFTILFFAIPTLIIALVRDVQKNKLKNRLFLTSVLSIFTYYSASIAFGVTYNVLHLIYIALFSTSLFGLIISISSISKEQVAKSIGNKLPSKGIYVFLTLVGASLFVAWLPDIISSLVSGHSLQLIEVYTTQITYVLDMGVLAPSSFICILLLKRQDGMGYILLDILLTLCCFVGILLPIQTVFQVLASISLPIGAVITKVVTFVVLAFFALYYNSKVLKSHTEL